MTNQAEPRSRSAEDARWQATIAEVEAVSNDNNHRAAVEDYRTQARRTLADMARMAEQGDNADIWELAACAVKLIDAALAARASHGPDLREALDAIETEARSLYGPDSYQWQDGVEWTLRRARAALKDSGR